MNNRKYDYALRNNNFEDELSELISFIDENNSSTEILELPKSELKEDSELVINGKSVNVNKFIIISLSFLMIIICYKAFDNNTTNIPDKEIYTKSSDISEILGDSETSSYNETSEMFSEENSSITYQSTENSSESEIPDDSETSLCSGTTEIVSQISTETNENKETGSQLYETAYIEDNFFIRTFFSDDAISKIKGESDNGEHLVDVSDFVELDSNGDVKSICKNEINISEGEWKSRDYRGDYVKNSNKISLRATVDNNDNKKDVVKIEFRIDIEENQFYVYMILDD